MTRDEALNVAAEALDYALENDEEYLSPETQTRWSEAARVLAQPRAADGLHARCDQLVALIAEATGEAWTFGYIGNVGPSGDDRAWYAFRPHPGRIGTREDRIGGVATDDMGTLASVLQGALNMARMLKS